MRKNLQTVVSDIGLHMTLRCVNPRKFPGVSPSERVHFRSYSDKYVWVCCGVGHMESQETLVIFMDWVVEIKMGRWFHFLACPHFFSIYQSISCLATSGLHAVTSCTMATLWRRGKSLPLCSSLSSSWIQKWGQTTLIGIDYGWVFILMSLGRFLLRFPPTPVYMHKSNEWEIRYSASNSCT